MRNPAESPRLAWRLSFMLPRAIVRAAERRLRELVIDGCGVDLAAAPLAVITAPSRERAFDQAARLFGARGGSEPPATIHATLESPGGSRLRDGWSIIVGADVAFAPTGLGAYVPALDLIAEPRAFAPS